MKKSFRLYYLGLILFGLFLAFPLLTSATAPDPSLRLNSGVGRFFSETSNTAVDTLQYSADFYILNNCGADLFVGNRTSAEWLSFKNNSPSCVSINFKNCGDSICNTLLENNSNCSSDCLPICGDGACEGGETCSNCLSDCGGSSCCGNGVCDNRVSLECYNSSESCPTNPNYYCSIEVSGSLVATGNFFHCAASCTDSYCESSISCPGDCPACGDSFCNASTGENNSNCSADCLPICGNGVCEGDERYYCSNDCHCGNGTCESSYGESFSNCSSDCHCGNGTCESSYGENSSTCVSDCHCGNGTCESSYGENQSTCSTDCSPTCGDGVCEGDEPHYCVSDCHCGNNTCESSYGETPSNCPNDCHY